MNIVYHHHIAGLNSIRTAYIAPNNYVFLTVHHDLRYVFIPTFFLYLYCIPLHVLSNNAHLREVTLFYTCSICYHHSLGAVMVSVQYTDGVRTCRGILHK